MRTRKHYFGLLAVMAMTMAGCSDNDPTTGGESGEGGIQNATSYLAVNIKMADVTTSRATDGGFEEYGTNDSENNVKSICALFFNEDGSYLTAGQKISSNDSLETNNSGQNTNIESTVTHVITLSPTTIKPDSKIKMLLFVNDQCQANWYNRETLNDDNKVGAFSNLVGKSLNEVLGLTTAATPSEAGMFEMTNSAYMSGNTIVQATDVNQSHFKTYKTEAENDTDKVAVYVERTVAKVNMSENESSQQIENNKLTGKEKSNSTDFTPPFHISASDNTNYYPITKDGHLSCFTVDGKKTAFAVKVLGWCANGVNKSGYLVKHISTNGYNYWGAKSNDDATLETKQWNNWNDENNNRSYWAEDINYNEGKTGESTSTGNELKLNFKKMPTEKTDIEYIYENTVVQAKAQYAGGTKHPNVTTMLVSAQIVPLDGEFDDGSSTNFTFTDNNSSVVKKATTLYRYNGILYTKEESILNIEKNVLKNYYYATTNGTTTTYQKIDDTWFATNYTNTNTTVKAVDGEKQYNGIYHALSTDVDIYTGENGSDKTTINAVLKDKFKESNKIDYFKDGKCFYQVPIEHPVTTGGTETGKIYGVVRNHSYVLTLNSISNIGAPDTEAGETIELIPGQDQYYYLGCTLNVLAWRKVNQTVQL